MSVMSALEAVYKADPVTAESMIDDIVLDTLADEALDNRDVLNKSAGAYVAQRVAVAKRALLRQYVSDISKGHYPDDEVYKAAEWLTGIEAYTEEVVFGKDAVWEENKHKRDNRGRFSRGVNQNRRVNPAQYGNDLQRVATPLRGPMAANKGTLPPVIDQDRAERTQAQYEQADEILREFGAAFSAGDRKKIDAVIQYKDADGNVKTLSTPLSNVANGLPDEAYQQGGLGLESDILSIQVDPGNAALDDEDLMRRVQDFNAIGAMGGSHLAALANMDPNKRTAFTQSLAPRGPEKGRLETLFNRFKTGADVLDATGHDKMAGMARFMGTYGPEAADVMDPRVRQAAYRYRGTEKEPDLALMQSLNSKDMTLVEQVARQNGEGPLAQMFQDKVALESVGGRGRPDRMKQYGPVEGSLRHNLWRANQENEQLSEDQLNMRVRSDVAAMHLLNTIPPDRMVAELSRKSGNILPSQGVLIDADGDVVSQAVGSGDDTYLPFNYANMKRSMNGGQYVRTRVQGGLTGEDIAAAVGNGARKATVVSSSGVHSIEFDPNLRGTRGGSDKARQMYRRYIEILDAVEGSGLYEQDIDPREKSKLRSRAAEIAGAHEGTDYDAAYKKLESEARAKASSLTDDEMNGLMEQATQMVTSQGGGRSTQQTQQQINDVYEELEQKATAQKASKLRLNAEGYRVALETLQQQFPYFIRNVSYEPLAGDKGGAGFLDSRGQQPTPGSVRQRLKAPDKGYVRPGGIKAAGTETGFYNTQGKHNMKGRVASVPPDGGGEGGGGAAPPGAPPASPPGLGGPTGGPAGGLQESVARLRNQAQHDRDQALTELSNVFSTLSAQQVSLLDRPEGQDWEQVKDLNNQQVAAWFLSQRNPKAVLSDPAKAGRLATALSDRNAVGSAFNVALQKGNGPDFFAAGGQFGGHQDAQSAANYVADLALKVVDSDLVTQPFVNAVGEKGDPFHVGTRPQSLTINGVPVNNITNGDQLNAFLKANPEVSLMAQKLGTVDDGDSYKPAAAVATDVSERVAVLRDLGEIIAAAKKDPDRQTGLSRGANLYVSSRTQDPKKFMDTLTRMNDGKPVNSAEDLIDLEKKWPDLKREAMKLQEAWSLVNAGRSVAMIQGGDVSGGPKDPNRPQGHLWVAKSLHPDASTRPARSRLERVSKDASPLAREISRRRLVGLPYVPTRLSKASAR